ncbi:MAG: M48 family metallopeptidase [Clostridia bacterium]|nr:M48 family metallopeptidase [Clostridia bacterium]
MKIAIILLALVGSLYSLVLSIVQMRSASNPTPANVADVFDAETYKKWKAYSRECSILSIVFTCVTGIITLAMLASGVHAAFASLFPAGVFMQLLSIIILEVAISFVVGIVREYVSDMIIEQKYGFNRTSIKTFITDCIRNLIIEFVLSLLLTMLLWGSHVWFGDWMILVFAVAMLLFSLFISFMYPLFSRIGNKFTPLEDGVLKDRLMELLTKHGYQVKAIEVMDASRRTTKLNAYFTGFGKMKTIVLYDNLVNAMDTDEICAVFAHELGHGLHKDVLKGQILNFGNMLLMGVLVWVVASNPIFCEAFGFEGINYGFAYVILGVLLGLFNPLISLLINARSRRAEYRADKQAVSEGYGPAMITALKKLARENFSHLAPSRINVVLEYSHPPLSERITAVEKELASTRVANTTQRS